MSMVAFPTPEKRTSPERLKAHFKDDVVMMVLKNEFGEVRGYEAFAGGSSYFMSVDDARLYLNHFEDVEDLCA
jgi:hypothetical protein